MSGIEFIVINLALYELSYNRRAVSILSLPFDLGVR